MSSLCSNLLSPYDTLLCAEFKFGCINAIGILDCDHGITDFTSAVEQQAAIDAGLLTILKKSGINADIPQGTTTTATNPDGCAATDIPVGTEMLLAMRNYAVNAANDSFAATLNGKVTFGIFYIGSEMDILVVEKNIVWTTTPSVVPPTNKEMQLYNIGAAWFFGVVETWERVTAPNGIYT